MPLTVREHVAEFVLRLSVPVISQWLPYLISCCVVVSLVRGFAVVEWTGKGDIGRRA
jgi:uncharacterized membrane protein YjdF